MRMMKPNFAMLSATRNQGWWAFKDRKWVRIVAAASLLLVVVLWVAGPPMGQAQGTNTAPTAVDDDAATAEETAVDINVVGNDTDADGDTLSVTSVTSPSNGTAVVTSGSTTTVTYTPDTDFNGADSFDYTLSDGTDTDTGAVTVTVGPPPAQPTGLTATAGNGQAALTWDDPSNGSITEYEYLQAQVTKLTASDGVADDVFGNSVAVDGDTAVAGAEGDDGDKGSAYVFTKQSGAWSRVAKLTAFERADDDHFGYSVAVEGDTVVVGAYRDDDNGSDSGSAYVFTKPNTGWADATETAKLTAFDGADRDEFGISVGVDGDTVVVGAWGDENDTGSAYVFTKPANGWTSTSTAAKLTAFDGDVRDLFGNSVGVDGATVVVGAVWDDDSGASSGSAYVFVEPSSGGWATATETAKLTAFDAASGDEFGYSVAVDGDSVVVGASTDNDNGQASGSAYLFTKPGSGWVTATEAAKLTASDGASLDLFGNSVAVEGDAVVVGAYKDDDHGMDSGSAYLFVKPSGGGWVDATETAKLTASDGAAGDEFGYSVAVDGGTVVVGAHRDDDKGSDSGSAYLHEVSDWTGIPDSAAGDTNATSYTVTGLSNDEEYSLWIRAENAVGIGPASDAVTATPTNTAPTAVDDTATTDKDTAVDIDVTANDTDPDSGTTLSVTSVTSPSNGTAAIMSGSTTTVTYTPDTDFNGADSFDYTLSDGTDTDTGTVTVLVGPSPAKPTGLTASAGDSQAALTWDDPSNSSITGYEYLLHTQVDKLNVSGGADDDKYFGRSVSMDGNTVVVGAPGENGGRGRAYVLTLQSGAWSQVAKLTASDRTSNDEFGYSVSVDGDTVVVGAHRDDDGGLNSGSAYVFTKPANGWADATETAKLAASDGAAGDRFGVSVGVDGDTVVVGARLDDDNGGSSGSAYVFTKPADGWTNTSSFAAKLTASDGAADDQFGRSVAVDGDTVVVGAFGDDDNGSMSGSAYVFTKPANGWVTATQTAKLAASDGAAFDYFGISIAVDGGTVVVGADLDDARRVDSGSAYVFTEPNSGWANATETAKLTASDGAGGDYFGFSVAVDEDTVVVGAAQDDDNGSNSGSAYVFKKPNSGGWATASETAKLTDSDGAADDNFGWSVAVDGDTVMVGAWQDDDYRVDSGSASLYEVSDWTAVPSSAAGETNATSYTVTGLANATEYNFRIRAANGVGASPASTTATVTPIP